MQRAAGLSIQDVQVASGDAGGLESRSAPAPQVVAQVKWGQSHASVSINVRFADDPNGIAQTLRFDAADAAEERGRNAGLWLGSVVASHLSQAQAALKARAERSRKADSPKPVKRVGPANEQHFRLQMSGIGTSPAPRFKVGGELALSWRPESGDSPRWVSLAVGARSGAIASGWSELDSWVGLGMNWRLTQAAGFWSPEVGLWGDWLGGQVRVTEPGSSGGASRSTLRTQARLGVEAGLTLSSSFDFVVAAGGEAAFGSLRVRQGDVTIAQIPAFFGVGEMGLRAAW